MLIADRLRSGPKNQQYIEWDVRNWSSALDFWLAHTNKNLSSSLALELGTRNGGLSLWLAERGACVVSTDLAPPAQSAIKLHENRQVSGRIQYELMDATRIPYESKFDVVVFKSVLGAIGRLGGKDQQQQAVGQIYKALKPGGELFFAENLLASPVHQFCRRKFVRWGATWRYVSIHEMQQFLAAFSKVHYSTVGFAGAFGRSEPQRNILSLFDQLLFNHAVPESWRYIIVGVAKK